MESQNRIEDLSGIDISQGENPYAEFITACEGENVSKFRFL